MSAANRRARSTGAGVCGERICAASSRGSRSWAGAGILPPANRAQARTPFDQLRAHSAALFPTLSAELRDRTGIDNGYWRSGGLEIAGREAETAANEWRSEGIAFEKLDEKQLRQHEPALATG